MRCVGGLRVRVCCVSETQRCCKASAEFRSVVPYSPQGEWAETNEVLDRLKRSAVLSKF